MQLQLPLLADLLASALWVLHHRSPEKTQSQEGFSQSFQQGVVLGQNHSRVQLLNQGYVCTATLELFSVGSTVTQTWMGTRTSVWDMRGHILSWLCTATKIMLWMLPELVRLHFVCDNPHWNYIHRQSWLSAAVQIYLYFYIIFIYNSVCIYRLST